MKGYDDFVMSNLQSMKHVFAKVHKIVRIHFNMYSWNVKKYINNDGKYIKLY
jgi:hypothetical protein